MIIVKSRLIFGLIKNIIFSAIKIVFNLFKWLKLLFALLVLISGLILHFTGALEKYNYLKIVLIVLFIIALIYPIYCLIKRPSKKGKKSKRTPKEQREYPNFDQRVSDFNRDYDGSYNRDNDLGYDNNYNSDNSIERQNHYSQHERSYQSYEQGYQQPLPVERVEKNDFIGYFKVAQNPNYVMAEYVDRYELFLQTENGLKKIREDYK